MSTQTYVNRESVRYLILNSGQYLLGDKLVKIQLQAPEIEGLNRKEKAQSGKLATKTNHAENLENLQADSLLAFTFTIISPITYTNHSHKLLALQNETAQEFVDTFTVYASESAIELERDSFLGETIHSADVHGLIKNYVKLGKTQKIVNKWRKTKGAYMVARNGEFVPYTVLAQAQAENKAPKIEKTEKSVKA